MRIQRRMGFTADGLYSLRYTIYNGGYGAVATVIVTMLLESTVSIFNYTLKVTPEEG